MVIKKIDIINFGRFKNFVWQNSVRGKGNNIAFFKKLNVIYGRNYSGKTTLSRIFRSLETGEMPVNYGNSVFTVSGDEEVNQTTIKNHNYHIRVYNRDFVNDNLSFPNDENNGKIKTFAIVGDKNQEIEKQIADIKKKIGDKNTGLKHELELKRGKKEQSKETYQKAENLLENKLKQHAIKIKNNREYGKSVYNISHIKNDISNLEKNGFNSLTDDEKSSKFDLLKQSTLPIITEKISISLNFDSLVKQAEPLLQRIIKPTEPIQDLVNNSLLEQWVKTGISHHKNKRTTCAFCHQPLPKNIWQILDAHFTEESEQLSKQIESAILSIENEINRTSNMIDITADKFYPEERKSFEAEKSNLEKEVELYRQDLKSLESVLQKRKNHLFENFETPNSIYNPHAIQNYINVINELIDKSNSKSETLTQDQEKAREQLRLSDVANFISTIDYNGERERIAELKKNSQTIESEFKKAEQEIKELDNRIITLQAELKDEQKGAEYVNHLLNHFFGHDGLRLEAQDSSNATVKFQIMRGEQPAYNLSEGECSLIAFCYFMAKLEEPETKGKPLIIYIDDPISSLDSNHIFFIYSLIESLIAKPIKDQSGKNQYRYNQLFISTHNLDFLKYLKRLSIPTDIEKQKRVEYFIIERDKTESNIAIMPDYLKNYVTEFNYLFHQIYKCKKEENSSISYEAFYSFGNNLRKFLEAFLFYKYPCIYDKNSSLERIQKFFGDDETAIALTNRLSNELSHLEEIFDRSIKPIDIPEISKLANYVLNKIETKDKEQYDALLESIGESES